MMSHACARKTRGLWARLAAGFFLILGLGCLGYYEAVSLETRYDQQKEEAWFARALKSCRGAESKAYLPKTNGDFIGQIDIPRIGVSAMILEGTGDRVLRLGVGHIRGTALPGENGNVSLAAHRDTFFRGLRHIRANDEIRLTTLAGLCRYRVDWTKVVKPDDIRVLNPKIHPMLTLITCYPFYYVGSAPDRFVVRAHQVSG
jgi:LPXTG-site transpeptidase (sortase) family protein